MVNNLWSISYGLLIMEHKFSFTIVHFGSRPSTFSSFFTFKTAHCHNFGPSTSAWIFSSYTLIRDPLYLTFSIYESKPFYFDWLTNLLKNDGSATFQMSKKTYNERFWSVSGWNFLNFKKLSKVFLVTPLRKPNLSYKLIQAFVPPPGPHGRI